MRSARQLVDNEYKRTKWGRIEGQIANATTKFLIHHGSLPSEVVDRLLTLVLSEKGVNVSTQRLSMYVRFCVESILIYTDDTEKYFELFKQLPATLKMRLVVTTKLAIVFKTTKEKRIRYLDHLKTIKSDADGWMHNL